MYPVKNVIFMQKWQSLQNLVAYELLFFVTLDDWSSIEDLTQFKIKVQNCVHIMMDREIWSAFGGFFMDDLMTACDIFMCDGMEHVDFPEDREVSAFLVIHPLRMVLFECKVFRVRVLVSVEKVVEDIFFALSDFVVQEDSSVASFSELFDKFVAAVEESFIGFFHGDESIKIDWLTKVYNSHHKINECMRISIFCFIIDWVECLVDLFSKSFKSFIEKHQ